MHEIGREQNQNTAMEFLILAIKILITEQKVNFLDTVCHICEKNRTLAYAASLKGGIPHEQRKNHTSHGQHDCNPDR